MIARLTVTLALALAACSGTSPRPHAGPPLRPADVAGRWHGTSRCTVHPSACHDEEAVYYFTVDGEGLAWKGMKVVDGREEDMGPVPGCTIAAATHTVTCPIPGHGAFVFHVDGDHMDGRLDLDDGTRYRTIAVDRTR